MLSLPLYLFFSVSICVSPSVYFSFSLAHSHTHTLKHSLTHSHTRHTHTHTHPHSLTHSLTHSIPHSALSLTHSLTHLLTHSLTSFSLKPPHHSKLIYFRSCQWFHVYLAVLCLSLLLVWFQTKWWWYSLLCSGSSNRLSKQKNGTIVHAVNVGETKAFVEQSCQV